MRDFKLVVDVLVGAVVIHHVGDVAVNGVDVSRTHRVGMGAVDGVADDHVRVLGLAHRLAVLTTEVNLTPVSRNDLHQLVQVFEGVLKEENVIFQNKRFFPSHLASVVPDVHEVLHEAAVALEASPSPSPAAPASRVGGVIPDDRRKDLDLVDVAKAFAGDLLHELFQAVGAVAAVDDENLVEHVSDRSRF